jgi:hypothetical protein
MFVCVDFDFDFLSLYPKLAHVCVARCGSKRRHRENICQRDWITCSIFIVNYLGSVVNTIFN